MTDPSETSHQDELLKVKFKGELKKILLTQKPGEKWVEDMEWVGKYVKMHKDSIEALRG